MGFSNYGSYLAPEDRWVRSGSRSTGRSFFRDLTAPPSRFPRGAPGYLRPAPRWPYGQEENAGPVSLFTSNRCQDQERVGDELDREGPAAYAGF